MFLDSSPSNQPEGTTREVWNVLISKLKDSYINEPGLGRLYINNPITASKDYIEATGEFMFPDGSLVLLGRELSNGGVNAEIGIIENTDNIEHAPNPQDVTYTKKLSVPNTYFKFDISRPIKVVGTYDQNGHRIIAWTDNTYPPRILNIDNLPFTVNSNKFTNVGIDIDKTLLFRNTKYPNIRMELKNNGSVKTGKYFVVVKYIDSNDVETDFGLPQGGLIVYKGNGTSNFEGTYSGVSSGKSIQIGLFNLDTSYKKVAVYIMSIINGQTTVNLLKIAAVASSVIVTYSGQDLGSPISLEEVLIGTKRYNKAKDIEIHKNSLYLANLEVDEEINYQQNANNIVPFYGIKEVNVTNNIIVQTFMPGQVYALYITWILNNGKRTRWFHIPGRIAVTGDKSVFNGDTLNYQVKDTTDKADTFVYTTESDGFKYPIIGSNTKSNMGFWENKEELYPSGFAGLVGQKVRHHVFPSIRASKSLHFSTSTDFGRTLMLQLGLKLTNVIPTTELNEKAVGYMIGYAKVDEQNANILTHDIEMFSGYYVTPSTSTQTLLSHIGNFKSKHTMHSTENSSGEREVGISSRFIRLHSIDLLKNTPSISNLFIRKELRYKMNLKGKWTNNKSNNPAISVIGKDFGKIAYYKITHPNIIEIPPETIKEILEYLYLKSGVVSSIDTFQINNYRSEDCLLLKTNDAHPGNNSFFGYTSPNIPFNRVYNSSINLGTPATDATYIYNENSADVNNPPNEQIDLISVGQKLSNVFLNFDTQQIIIAQYYINKNLTDTFITPKSSSMSKTVTGDCYSSKFNFIVTNPRYPLETKSIELEEETGDRVYKDQLYCIREYTGVFRNNPNLRIIDPSIEGSKFYKRDQTNELTFLLNAGTTKSGFIETTKTQFAISSENLNRLLYNEDIDIQNEFTNDKINDGVFEPDSIQKYKVTKSLPFDRYNNKLLKSFSTFLEEDYYESNSNRGEINNLASFGDVLFIHHTYGLFRTIGNEKLRTDTLEVTLGSRNIFEIEPKDIIYSQEGTLGNQNQFGIKVTKIGYIFVDVQQYKIFILNSSAILDITTGIRGFFEAFCNAFRSYNDDNPYNNRGISIGFDEENNRILFSFLKGTIYNQNYDVYSAITLSYSLDKNNWICFHNYVPSRYVNNRKRLFSLTNTPIDANKITYLYLHNNYYNPGKINSDGNPLNLIYKTVIKFVFRTGDDALFFNINWRSNSYKANTEIIKAIKSQLENKTFTRIRALNSRQDTGYINLVPVTAAFDNANIRQENEVWQFNELRDYNIDVFKRESLVDNFLLVELEYDNTSQSLDGWKFLLSLHNIDFKALKAAR